MKKFLTIAIIAVLILATVFTFAACNEKGEGQIKIVVPDGAPALAIAKLLSERPVYKQYDIEYEIVPGATEVSAKLVNGEADFAIVPTNIAANLYNKGTDIRLISANTFGNLYIVGTESVTDLAELKGEVVCNIGRGGTPDLSLKYILDQKGIAYRESETADDSGATVSLRYVSNGSELIPLLKTGKIKFGVLGEPAVTQAISVVGAERLFAIHELWAEVSDNLDYTQAVLVGSTTAIDDNEGIVDWLSERLTENAQWILDNPTSAQAALSAAGSTVAVTYTTEIIAACNVRFVAASDAKPDIDAFLAAIAEFNPAFIGGAVPDDDFYYKK